MDHVAIPNRRGKDSFRRRHARWMEKKGGETRRNNGGIIGSRRGERESLGRQSNPRIKRLIRRKPVDFPPRVHLVVGQRRRGKGGELYSERACTSFERSKSINSSPSTFLFFLFFFPCSRTIIDHDSRIVRHPVDES